MSMCLRRGRVETASKRMQTCIPQQTPPCTREFSKSDPRDAAPEHRFLSQSGPL